MGDLQRNMTENHLVRQGLFHQPGSPPALGRVLTLHNHHFCNSLVPQEHKTVPAPHTAGRPSTAPWESPRASTKGTRLPRAEERVRKQKRRCRNASAVERTVTASRAARRLCRSQAESSSCRQLFPTRFSFSAKHFRTRVPMVLLPRLLHSSTVSL